MLLTFLGHSCWQIRTDSSEIIIDPFLRGNPKAAAKPADIRAPWILVTHGHSDHLGDAVEIAAKNNGTIISVFEIASYCSRKGVKTHGMHIGGRHNFADFSVKLTQALHGSSMGVDPIEYLGSPCGFLIFSEGKTIYFAGDTGLFGDMELIGRLHPIDLAVLPIGDNFTMGPEDALEAVRLLKPKNVIPCHYNTFDLIAQDPAKFKQAVESATGVPVTVLKPGETFELGSDPLKCRDY